MYGILISWSFVSNPTKPTALRKKDPLHGGFNRYIDLCNAIEGLELKETKPRIGFPTPRGLETKLSSRTSICIKRNCRKHTHTATQNLLESCGLDKMFEKHTAEEAMFSSLLMEPFLFSKRLCPLKLRALCSGVLGQAFTQFASKVFNNFQALLPENASMSPEKGIILIFKRKINLPTINFQGICWFSGR